MRLSNSFFLTRRENPNDEYSESSKLLIKSGMIHKNEAGIYSYLPIGLKVINNIENVIREEFNRVNGEELLLPTIMSDEYDNENDIEEVYQIVDRNNNSIKLAHSSLELFSDLVKHKVKSYKDLHFTLFQINNKYRDEERFELGLVRMREFLGCESYSFDSDEGGLDVSYDKMFLTFKNIFSRLSITPIIVRGNEGEFSEEFQVLSKYGDNVVVRCPNCGYTSNIEDASSKITSRKRELSNKKRILFKAGECKGIKELSKKYDVKEENILKSVVIKVDDIYKLALLRGNSELNVNKLMKIYNTKNIEIPSILELEKLGVAVDYIGPINCTMEIIADNEVKLMHNFMCGSNKKYYYFKNVNVGKDFRVNRFEDIKLFNESSLCPICKNKCDILSGIEVGQINKINDELSRYYNITYTNELNEKDYAKIGNYNIGIDRCLNAVVEENHDENGIIWPVSIAPYKVAIVVVNMNHEKCTDEAEKLYKKFINNGIETIYDDRKDSIGVKLNDMDLIGIPIRITIGNNIDNDMVEVKIRSSKEEMKLKTGDVYNFVLEFLLEHS